MKKLLSVLLVSVFASTTAFAGGHAAAPKEGEKKEMKDEKKDMKKDEKKDMKKDEAKK